MKSHLLGVSVVVVTCQLCHGQQNSPVSTPSPQIAKKLQGLLDSFVSDPDVVNYVALVDAGQSRWRWAGAAGIAHPQTNERMTVQHQFRVASVTKTFTAVVVLQLIEENRFTLETPLASIIKEKLPGGYAVDDLHAVGEKLGNTITVRQLLSHTSGLADYFLEPAIKGSNAGMDFGEAWIRDIKVPGSTGLNKQWSPTAIVSYYFTSGFPSKAKFSPGNGIFYSDTTYVLLAIAVEKVTGKSLAANYRERILDKLGLKDTYLEWYEPKRGDLLAHHFVKMADKDGENLDIVAIKANTSADWAGGGLVSTVEDLNCFIRALFQGKLFRHESTLVEMTTPLGRLPDDTDYGLGIRRKTTPRGHREYWGHFGYWGVGMFYCPTCDVSMVYCRDQPESVHQDLEAIDGVLEEAGLSRLNWL